MKPEIKTYYNQISSNYNLADFSKEKNIIQMTIDISVFQIL